MTHAEKLQSGTQADVFEPKPSTDGQASVPPGSSSGLGWNHVHNFVGIFVLVKAKGERNWKS